MPITIPRGKSDAVIERLIESLRNYEADHPEARIDLYRQNPVSVRIRIIDAHLEGLDRTERCKLAWSYLDQLPDEVQADISSLLLLTPQETALSFANVEFEDPVPSLL